MELLFKKVKAAFPKAIVQSGKNYVSFTFGGGLYYQLRVQKDKVRMMATNYPNKAKIGECLKLIKKHNIEGQDINGSEIIFEVGARNPEIFTLRIEMPYSTGQLEKDSFNSGVVDSCAKFHDILLPLVNNFMKEAAGNLYTLMGGSVSNASQKTSSSLLGQKKSAVSSAVSLQQELASSIHKKFPDAAVKKIDKDNYLDIHLPSVHPKRGTHLGINTAKGLIKIVFYCREEQFNKQVLVSSKKIEAYGQGLRIKGNPTYTTVEKAVEAAIDFVLELKKASGKDAKDTKPANTQTESKKPLLKEAVGKSSKKGSDFEEMIKAYKKGDLEKVAAYIEKGNPPLQFNVDESVIENELIAVCAAGEVDLNSLKRIINRGDDLNARNIDEDKYTAVHFCAWDGKVEALALLLRNGASPDIVGADGRTPLHLATAMGHTKAVEILLNAGVDIDRRIPDGIKYYSKNGATALREALINQRWEVVDFLVNAGADLSGLKEPCVESYKGKNDLFDVIRLLDKDGEYSDGNFDENKLTALERKIKGGKSYTKQETDQVGEDEIDLEKSFISLRVGDKVNSSMFKTSANLNFWFGDLKEKCIKDILYSDEHEKYLILTADKKGNAIDYWDLEAVNSQLTDNYKFEIIEKIEEELVEVVEEEEVDEYILDLEDYDVNEGHVINYICDKIKSGKYLTNLLYINKALESKRYAVDNHQAYFFDSGVKISDRELEGFLVVNMDGFYSNCMNDEEMQMVFSWSGVNDIEYEEDGDDSSIDIIADQGRLTIKKEGSHSLKILYTYYKYVWETINDTFKDEPIIMWNDVWGMGIKEVGFSTFNDYVTFDVSQEEGEEIEEKEELEEEIDESGEQESQDEETEDDDEIISFYVEKPYEKQYLRFQEIASNTGILTNDIKVEPNSKERDELWDIVRVFAERIYQIDAEKNPNKEELNTLCFYNIVALHWCDLMVNDKRFCFTNGRFRRDVLALALCFYARIDRSYDYYDHVKLRFIMPHMQFSVLLWSINSIVNIGQDNLFGMFTQEQAQKAQELFTEMDKKNQASGGYGYVDPRKIPDNHPLKAIWHEVFSLFNNVRIPYQFIRNYISLEMPKRSFLQGMFSGRGNNSLGVNVTLLESDKQNNIAFLDHQINHKQFPDGWNLYDDLAFVYIYFATSDGNISKEEKDKIITLIGEWIGEKDKNKLNQFANASIAKAQTLFNKDNSEERFSFALENIRRHFYVTLDYDPEKTNAQLKLICNDLIQIAEVDDLWVDGESSLFETIRMEWGVSYKDEAEENSEEETDDEAEEAHDSESEEETEYNDFIVTYQSSLTDEKVEDLISRDKILCLGSVTSLTDRQAELLSKSKNYIYLDSLASLTDRQAAAFSKYKGAGITFDGILSLNDSQAEMISRLEGALRLDGITSLSDKQALIFASHNGELSLDGLTSLTDNQAEYLSSHQSELSLDGVTSLSDRQAAYLATHKGDLYLDSLSSLTDKQAEIFSNHIGTLTLNGISELTDKQISFLSKHQGSLCLDGLVSVSDKALEILGSHKGEYLSLNGLTSISDKVALALASHEGSLYLNGITTLSDKASLALALHQGELTLDGLTSLSDKAAAALAEKGISITQEDENEEEESEEVEVEQDDFDVEAKISEFYCDNVWEREGYDLDKKPFPDVVRDKNELGLLFRKFTAKEVDIIVKKIKQTKSYILLPFIKEILGREMDLSSLKPPFWFIPIAAYGNNISSILYFNQDGIYNTFKNSESLSMVAHVDVWKSISVEPGYNGLFDDDSDDNNLSTLKISWHNPNTGNSGSTNIVEFHGEDYGASLKILKAIWDYAWKDVVDRSRNASQFLLGPPPFLESFNNWDELIDWAKK